MKKKRLYVQKVSREELLKRWKISGKFLPKGELFIRSNSKGVVNWSVAPVYSLQEIQDHPCQIVFTTPSEIYEL